MKKIVILLMVLFVSVIHGQKKKKSPVVSKKEIASTVLATSKEAKVVSRKSDIFLVVAKDTMVLATKKDKVPSNCKITVIKVKTNTFYLVTWNENAIIDSKVKKEDVKIIESQIWNPTTKTLLIGNTQKSIDITEIEYLDKLKTASQTVYKKRNEGYLFTLLANGEFTLSNKSSITTYAYNEKTARYEPKKK